MSFLIIAIISHLGNILDLFLLLHICDRDEVAVLGGGSKVIFYYVFPDLLPFLPFPLFFFSGLILGPLLGLADLALALAL